MNHKTNLINIKTPIYDEIIKSLKVGDNITITGTIYTARDAAHKRMTESIIKKEAPPFEFDGQIVFYAGPCPAPAGKPIGSIGPTTAGRMDAYAPILIGAGLKIMIGKGNRKQPVVDAIKAHKGLYFAAVGGVAALLAKCVVSSEVIAYEELGTEAIWKLYVEKMPLIVAIDHQGQSVYEYYLPALKTSIQ